MLLTVICTYFQSRVYDIADTVDFVVDILSTKSKLVLSPVCTRPTQYYGMSNRF